MPIIRTVPLAVSEFNARLKCAECTIFIGIGHFDAVPMVMKDGCGPYCRACYRAELRRRRPGWRTVAWAE
jgi:hypothetical protein